MPYRITIDDATFESDDLTLDEAIAIEQATGTAWSNLNPMRSGEHCKLVIAAYLARTRGPEEAAKVVGSMTLREVLAAVKWVDDDLPTEYEDGLPKAADAQAIG